MKSLVTLAVLALAASMASAADIPVELEGKNIIVKATTLNRPIAGADRNAGAQDSPLACSFLYYGHLARADIPAAAALSTDPKATADKWTQYRERVGAEEFRKMMAAYFTAGNVVLAELSLGDAVMLVVKTDEYTAGQIYVRQGNQWLWAERPPAETGKAFGQVLNMIQSGKIKFQGTAENADERR